MAVQLNDRVSNVRLGMTAPAGQRGQNQCEVLSLGFQRSKTSIGYQVCFIFTLQLDIPPNATGQYCNIQMTHNKQYCFICVMGLLPISNVSNVT